MILLTVDEIIEIHNTLTLKTGGSNGLRDKGLLESAVYSAISGFADEEAYPTIEEKSARLMYAITNNHPFVDGNKRIGVLVMLVTLRLNGTKINYSQKELIELSLDVAGGIKGYNDILNFIISHK